jgi:hypothetical protein
VRVKLCLGLVDRSHGLASHSVKLHKLLFFR